jgi:predicted N-acetyltransferase YhbS
MGFEFRPATSVREVQDAYELAARVFGPNYFDSKAHKERLLRLEPAQDPRDVVIGRQGGETVAIVRIVDRTVSLAERALKVGGITAVAVRPDVQGQGAGRAVMEAALERSRERGDALSIAFARRAVDGFYWRLGYVGVGCHPRITIRIGESPNESNLRIEDGFRRERMDAYARAYDQTYRNLPLRFVRDESAWDSICERLSWPPTARFVSVLDAARSVGYYVVADGAVIEAAAIESPALLRDVLIHHVGNAGELVLALHPHHPVASQFHRDNHTTSIRHAWDGGHVVRVLDGAGFLAGLAEHAQCDRRTAEVPDTRDHATARQVLLDAAGVVTNGKGMLSPLPAWTRIDEF